MIWRAACLPRSFANAGSCEPFTSPPIPSIAHSLGGAGLGLIEPRAIRGAIDASSRHDRENTYAIEILIFVNERVSPGWEIVSVLFTSFGACRRQLSLETTYIPFAWLDQKNVSNQANRHCDGSV